MSAAPSAVAASGAIDAPAVAKASSANEASPPAPLSATTSSPISTMRLTVSGDAATRRSYARLSLTIATFIKQLFPNGRAGTGAHNAAALRICEEPSLAVAQVTLLLPSLAPVIG